MSLRDARPPHGVVANITNDRMSIVAIAEYAVEVPRLPQTAAYTWPRGMRRSTLGIRDERAQIGSRSRSLNQQMQMIRHEAVRKNFEVVTVRGFRKLQSHDVDQGFVGEAVAPRKRAQRKEIDLSAGIRDVRETLRAHASCVARNTPINEGRKSAAAWRG